MAQRHVSLLKKGRKFTPISHPKGQFKSSLKDFTRKVKIQDVFFDQQNSDTSIRRNKSNRPIYTPNQEINNVCNLIELLQPQRSNVKDNLTTDERIALDELTSNNDLIIKPADKSGNFVLLDKIYYRDKLVLQGHLESDTYEKVSNNEDNNVMKNLKKLVQKHQNALTKKEQDFLTDFQWKTSNMYVLPKIHKSKIILDKIASSNQDFIQMSPPDDLKGRPIIAGPISPTQRLSEFLDVILQPIVTTLKTYIKDDWDFLSKLPRESDSPCSLYSYDVTSLYTSIPHDLGIQALKFWIHEKRDILPERFTELFILESATFVLESNNFIVDDVMYKQKKGTAMGTKFAPSYACLTVGFLEETKLFPTILREYFDEESCRYIETHFFRYMDDGFIALPLDLDPLKLKAALNDLNESIRFTMERGKKDIPNYEFLNFLDIKIILHNQKYINTDIYYKETNPHKYMDYKSAHPDHIKQTIPFNLAKRIVVFVSDSELVEIRLKELEQWLLDCHYPKKLVKNAFHRAKLQGPAPEKRNTKILPLVTTYYPQLNCNNVMKTIKSVLNNLSDQSTKRKFENTKTILALKQPPNITSILTNAKFLSNNVTSTVQPGISLCNNSRCKLCKLYLQPVSSFETSNHTIWNIKSSITCHSKNCVYFLSCNLCDGAMTYIGQTTNLRSRMNGHISESRTGTSTCNFPKHVFECGTNRKNLVEPFFKIYVFMSLNDSKLLTSYEETLFRAGHALLNT